MNNHYAKLKGVIMNTHETSTLHKRTMATGRRVKLLPLLVDPADASGSLAKPSATTTQVDLAIQSRS